LLYAFEINVRASTILGYIGAGGIGVFLQRSLSQFRYDQTSIIVLVIFAVVLVIDTISNRLRERLL
jgi:phosphonate transport system permease protein